jgi:hypothetical protein
MPALLPQPLQSWFRSLALKGTQVLQSSGSNPLGHTFWPAVQLSLFTCE